MFLTGGFFSFIDNITILSTILLVFGTALFAIEMFIPGFGFFGCAGIISYIIAIIVTAKDFVQVLSMIVLLLAILAIMTTICLILISKGKIPAKLILKDSIDEVSIGSKNNSDMNMYLGMTGIAVSTLRPSGICEFDGVRLDVITEGEFIAGGTNVVVSKIDEGHIVVRPVK